MFGLSAPNRLVAVMKRPMETMTAKQRVARAKKASKAAAEARKAKAKKARKTARKRVASVKGPVA